LILTAIRCLDRKQLAAREQCKLTAAAAAAAGEEKQAEQTMSKEISKFTLEIVDYLNKWVFNYDRHCRSLRVITPIKGR